MSRPILDGPTMSQRYNKKVNKTHNATIQPNAHHDEASAPQGRMFGEDGMALAVILNLDGRTENKLCFQDDNKDIERRNE